MRNLLKPSLLVASALLIMQAVLLHSSEREEYLPEIKPMSGFPLDLGDWHFLREAVVEPEIRDFLHADDLLSRVYADSSAQQGAELFVAAFKTLSNGAAPHSPKNCLPASGFTPLLADEITLDAGGRPITVNRYVVARGEERSLVLYWYQSRDRAVASEYRAKFFSIADAIRLNRTDTALVRVVVPIRDDNRDQATKMAADFVRAFFGPLRGFLPA
jgi:EpsI family protein